MEHFRGLKNVVMILVVEGNGTPENCSREVRYFYDLEKHGGTHGGFIGKIDPMDRPWEQGAQVKATTKDT